MWAVISDNTITQTLSHPKALTLNNIQYPESIFSSSWTDTERKGIGILPYIYEGDYVQNMFYTSSESSPSISTDKVVITRTKSARDIDKIKAMMKEHINTVLSDYLTQTDWIIIRKADTGENPPADLAKWRTDLRTTAANLEASIDAKSTVSDLEKMTIFTQEMADAGKTASELYDWPKNPRDS